MQCPACRTLTLGRTVCPVCGCDLLEFNLQQSGEARGTRQRGRLGWWIGFLGRVIVIAGLLVTLRAIGAENASTRAPSLLASGFAVAITGMLLVLSGYLFDLFRSNDSLRLAAGRSNRATLKTPALR